MEIRRIFTCHFIETYFMEVDLGRNIPWMAVI